MVQKDAAAWEASLAALTGILSNPVNQDKTVASNVETSINIGVSMANRWEQIVGTANMTAPVIRTVSIAAVPATPAINYAASVGTKVNQASTSVPISSVPTTVKDPGGNSIANLGGG